MSAANSEAESDIIFDLGLQGMHPDITILVPVYGAAALLRNCLASVARFTPPGCFVYVLDDATPDDSIREICEEVQKSMPKLRYVRSEINRGFAGSCNWGCECLRETGSDLLLLNSNTEVTAGFLEEMQAVLYLHERHGVVSPRGNDAAMFSLPLEPEDFEAFASHAVWQRVKDLLPRYQVMPTAAGFCMLIKAEILNLFGLFDAAYAPGNNEANEFVCRINRYGYSALAANRAYVIHNRCSAPASRASLDQAPSEPLLRRYPEYERKFADYESIDRDPVERFAALYAPHRPRILYDLFHLTAAHTGTSDFGLNLLRELARIVESECDLFVGVDPGQRFFAHELAGYRIYKNCSDSPMIFDLVFKPCQLLFWSEFRRMERLAPRLSYTMLDIIGVRCDYLNSARRQILLQNAAALSDCVFTISEFSRSDFSVFYRADIPFRVIYPGTNSVAPEGGDTGEYVLVMGNNLTHKGVMEAIQQMNGRWPLVVLGGEKEPAPVNVRWLASGTLSRQHLRELFANARVLVYPSHYEGFGLPVMDALALGKPVVVLDTAINRELASTLADSNLYRISSMKDLGQTVAELFLREPARPSGQPRRWREVAEEYAQAFRELLGRDFDSAKMRARWQILRTIESADGL